MDRVQQAPRAMTRLHHSTWMSGVWLAGVALAWWAVTRQQIADTDLEQTLGAAGMATPAAIGWLAVSAVFGRFFALACEAAFYWVWWRSLDQRFRFGRFFVVLAVLSLIDAWAETLQGIVRDHAPSLASWLAPVLGLGLLRTPAATGTSSLTATFASLGLLTAIRVALMARVQAREIGRSVALPLVVTSCAWLVTRLAMWWGLDLARGMSPMP